MYSIIHQPAPNSIQSGSYGNGKWVLEFPTDHKTTIDPLTGNAGSADMMRKVSLIFDSKDEAVAYAKSKGIVYQVLERAKHTPKGRSYGENFDFDRKFPWTH
jgi:NADH dehydrogenase ubiquinone Fe-S protein 4